MLGCDDVSRELSELVDGKLPLIRRMQVYAHLAMCKVCRQVLRSLARTVDLLHQLRDRPPEPDAWD